MRSFVGTYIWDLFQAPDAWKDLALGISRERGLALAQGQSIYAVEWDGERTAADVQVSQVASIAVVLFGAVRMRPDLSPRADVAGYVAQTLARRQPVETALADLDGEFILLAWDASTGTAFLATDPTGHRGLYYSFGPGGIAWSSHPWRVARLLGVPQIDREALNLYFGLKGVPAPWTILSGVRKVRPGHVLRLDREGRDEHEYWSLVKQAGRRYEGDFAAAREELLALLMSAIQRYVEDASSPVGIFLSGGLDSTALLALASRLDVPLRAFSVGYMPLYHGDESGHARLAAFQLGIPIEVCYFSPHAAAELAQEVLPRLPEPAADPTLLPQLFLAQHTAGKVRTVLDGTGSDVIFAGTTKYTAEHYARLYAYIPRPVRRNMIEPLSRMLPASRRWRLTNLVRKWQFFMSGCELPAAEREVLWTCFVPRPIIARLLHADWLAPDDLGAAYLRSHRQRLGTGVGSTSFMTLKGHTPWVDLLKLHSLEQESGISVRTPFLSPRLVEFGLCLPDAFKVRGNQGKVVLREACAGLVPPSTLQRRKAIFATPISQWLNGALRETFMETLAQPTGLFDMTTVQRMIKQNALGWRDWQSELWALFVLQRWWIANKGLGVRG